jgi:hypothetical protein
MHISTAEMPMPPDTASLNPASTALKRASLDPLILQRTAHRVQGRPAGADFLSRFIGLNFSQSLDEQISHLFERRIGHGDPDRFDIFNGASTELSRWACQGDQNNSWTLADVHTGDKHGGVAGHLILDFQWSQRLNAKIGSRGTDFIVQLELHIPPSGILKEKAPVKLLFYCAIPHHTAEL